MLNLPFVIHHGEVQRPGVMTEKFCKRSKAKSHLPERKTAVGITSRDASGEENGSV